MVRLASLLVSLPLLALAGVVAGDAVVNLQKEGRVALDAQIAKSKTCSKETLTIRREWGDLSKDDRRAYIKAVLCLTEASSKFPAGKYPGVKTRYDDFVAVHVNQTGTIHGTGNFLSWHRYFVWAYEHALRGECGYTGYQPYWDYGRWAEDPEHSPLFDGSDTSMSGNGEKIEHQGLGFSPAGNGGGCVTSGPFKNMTVRLGPVVAIVDPPSPRNPQADGLGDNSRCLRRDIGPYLTRNYGRTQNIVDVIKIPENFGDFQAFLEGGRLPSSAPGGGFGGGFGGGGPGRQPGTGRRPNALPSDEQATSAFLSLVGQGLRKRAAAPQWPEEEADPPGHGEHGAPAAGAPGGGMGLHGVGHFTISGDPGSDPFVSPNDPAFWLHHAMIDRVWSIWQTLKIDTRTFTISGRTNVPARPTATLDDIVTLDLLAKDYPIRDLVSTVDGPFCYTYE